jgi:serine protease
MALAAGMLVLGFAATAPAATAHAATGARHGPPVHVINLHKAYLQALRHVKVHKKVVLFARGVHLAAKKGARSCTEPDHCNLVYHGGPVEHSVKLYLLLWGPNWGTDPAQEASASYLESFYSGLGVQPQDNWSTITDQYTDSTGHPFFNGSVFAGTFTDTTTPPSGVTQAQLTAESDAFDSREGIPANSTDDQVVIATQSGTCPQGFAACGGSYCAYHSSDDNSVPFTNLPYILDAGTSCGEDFISSQYDGFSMIGGHEYAETITDPYPDSGWWDPNDPYGGEIGDKCVWGGGNWGGSDPYGDVNLSTGLFGMQSLYSNASNGCVMSKAQGDTVTVTNPGAQKSWQNSRLDLQMKGKSSGGLQLSWSASGLPPGLTIDPGTGLISGVVKGAPGQYNVTVTAADTSGANGTASFTWTVKADVGSQVKNVASGTCLNDFSGRVTSGNPIVMWKCGPGGLNEKFSHPTNPGSLVIYGQCLTDPANGKSGTKLVIQPCTGVKDQLWKHKSDSEYVNQRNGLCLTDPGSSSTNGTQTQVRTCRDDKDQRWNGS